MFAKVKSPVFIDFLVVELLQRNFSIFKAVLKDENGSVCSALETSPVQDQRFGIYMQRAVGKGIERMFHVGSSVNRKGRLSYS